MIDESSDYIKLYPEEDWNAGYSHYKYNWVRYYERCKQDTIKQVFEICENQFKKFKENGIIPMDWDW